MRIRHFLIAAVSLLAFAACTQELDVPGLAVPDGFKTVVLNAESTQTKSTIANDGAFAWAEGDVISVYATDGKFYDFTYAPTTESPNCFVGVIPAEENVTTVAVYPVAAANGTNEGIYDETDHLLNLTLKNTIEVEEGRSNIPMVATFAEGATKVAFRQVGAAFKFHVTGAPSDFYADFTFTGGDPVGTFCLDTEKIGEPDGTMQAAVAEEPKTVTAHYTSTAAQGERDFYIPVATGTYTKIEISFYTKNAENVKKGIRTNDVRTRDNNYVLGRGDIFIMRSILVDDQTPMTITKVTPFFSDAKVTFGLHTAATNGYAFYIDGATDPVIYPVVDKDFYHVGAPYDADNNLDNGDSSASGTLRMGALHTVSVAPVGADGPIAALKSDEVSFTTASMVQLNGESNGITDNKGPHQVTVWMKPYDQEEPDGTIKDWYKPSVTGGTSQTRVYRVQLFDVNDPTAKPIYELYTVEQQFRGKGAFQSSSWVGKISDSNVQVPDRLSFGFLDPSTTYYFRARTIAPTTVPYFGGTAQLDISSKNGESAWSAMFPLTTEPAHVPTEDEVLYQGFDDMTFSADFANRAAGLTPYLNLAGDKNFFMANAASVFTLPWTGEWNFDDFNTTPSSEQWGILDANGNYKDICGSLAGWHQESSSSVVPGFGFMRFGTGVAQQDRGITSPALFDNLSETEQICIVKLHAGPSCTTAAALGVDVRVDYLVPDAASDGGYRVVLGKVLQLDNNRNYTDKKNYVFTSFGYQERTTHVKLKKGYKIRVVAPAGAGDERILLGDITVTIAPDGTVYEGGEDTGASTVEYNKAISDPDGTDYDVFKMGTGRFPISYWYHPYIDPFEDATLDKIRDCGINVIMPFSHSIGFVAVENTKKLLTYCNANDMRLIARGNYHDYAQASTTQAQEFACIDQYCDDPCYVGHYVADEPSSSEFGGFQAWQSAYTSRYPGKVAYVNLFPSYANSGQLGDTSYEVHLDKWMAGEGLRSVSFDFYPLKDTRAFRSDYYWNLDLIRERTLAKRIHFWMIGSGGWLGTTESTVQREDEYRWNAFSAIAMGSKGYAYFCYAFPPEYGPNSDKRFIVDVAGDPTANYPIVKKLNQDIQVLAAKLSQSHADGGIMTPLKKYVMYQPRKDYGKLTSVTGDDSITGCFRAPDGKYQVLVTNLLPTSTGGGVCTVTLHFDNTVTSVTTTSTETGATTTGVPVLSDGLTLTFPEGEAILVEWE